MSTNFHNEWEATTRECYARGGYYLPVQIVQAEEGWPCYEVGEELTVEEAVNYRGDVRVILRRESEPTTWNASGDIDHHLLVILRRESEPRR